MKKSAAYDTEKGAMHSVFYAYFSMNVAIRSIASAS